MSREDLKRPILIHCCKDGTITYRTRKEKVFNDVALPVFSVNTEEEAVQLQVRFCRQQYDPHPQQPNRPWYTLNDFSGELDDLAKVTQMFREFFHEYRGGYR